MLDGRRGQVTIIGNFSRNAATLEHSYSRAFVDVGWESVHIDWPTALRHHIRGGGIGWNLSQLLSVHPWMAKASREILVSIARGRPDLILCVGNTCVLPGALAQLRASLGIPTVLYWPDPLVNLDEHTRGALALFDVVATYSEATIAPLGLMGARRCHWLPFAADPLLPTLVASAPRSLRFPETDIAFVGNWRPEREAALDQLLCRTNLRVSIWGSPDWKRRSRSSRVLGAWQGTEVYGSDLASAVKAAKVSLNVIDETNFPAANMRFFEIPSLGGCQLASECPEMAATYADGESVAYFTSHDHLVALAQELILDDERRNALAARGRKKTYSGHTYVHRVRALLAAIG